MKLATIYESSDPLDQEFEFTEKNWLDPEVHPDHSSDHFQNILNNSPPPGINKYPGRVTNVDLTQDEDGLINVTYLISLKNYALRAIEYGEDPYSVLDEIKAAAGPQAATLIYNYMRSHPEDFRTAMISNSDDQLGVDSYPTQSLDL